MQMCRPDTAKTLVAQKTIPKTSVLQFVPTKSISDTNREWRCIKRFVQLRRARVVPQRNRWRAL
jgi:hypothetical protein